MQWSQLKKRFEETFAESAQGRVQIWATRYRDSHDQAGECWVTFDKEQIINMADLTYCKAYYGEAQRIREQGDCLDYTNDEQKEAYFHAYDQAQDRATENSIFHSEDLKIAMEEYLNVSVDEALDSSSPLLRAFALLDRRFGKRRLLAFNPLNKHPIEQKFYELRCLLDGVPSRSNNSLQAQRP